MKKQSKESEALLKVCERYLALRQATWKPSTIRTRFYVLRRFVRWLAEHYPGVVRFSLLRRHPHMEEWIASLYGQKPRSVYGTLDIMAMFLNDQIEWDWPDPPPPGLILHSDLPPIPKQLPKPLSPTDDLKLMGALEADPSVISLGLQLLRHTGMRCGELLLLRASHVMRDREAFRVLRVPAGKTYEERLVPLLEHTLALIDKMMQRRGSCQPAHPECVDLFFINEEGLPIRYHTLWRYLKKTARKAGVCQHESIHLHRLRHTFATEMARSEISFPALMRLLGHKKPEMTLRYVALSAVDVRNAYTRALTALPVLPPCRPPVDTSETAGAQELIHSKFQSLISQIDSYRRDPYANPRHAKHLLRLEKRLRAALDAFKQSP